MDPNALEHAWEAGKATFSDVALPFELFRDRVGARVDGVGRANDETLRGADLYLACACEVGLPAAQAHLHALLVPLAGSIASRFGARAPDQDDIVASVMEKLLIPRDGFPPRIASYDGVHALGAWVRVVALRTAIDKFSADARIQPLESAVLESLHATTDDPELVVMHARDGALLRTIIERACRSLDRRSRRILRQALVERLTVDDLATLYGVHRSNAARSVRRALDLMTQNAHEALAHVGGLDRTDVGRIELSLSRWLETTVRETDRSEPVASAS